MKNAEDKVIAILWIVLGIIPIIAGINIQINHNRIMKNAVEANAIITAIEYDRRSSYNKNDSPDVYVEFEANGQIYSGLLDYYQKGIFGTMHEGDSVKIWYDSANPNDFFGAKESGFVAIGLGLIFVIFGGVVFVVLSKK